MASDCLRVRGFRVSFIPLAGRFSPFPHGTGSLSVAEGVEPWRVVPPASHKLTGVRGTQVSDQEPASPVSTGLSPALVARSNAFESARVAIMLVLQPQQKPESSSWFGLLPVRSPLLRESRLISLVGLLRCFSSPTALRRAYGFSTGCPDITLDGLPHWDTQGSSLACSSP